MLSRICSKLNIQRNPFFLRISNLLLWSHCMFGGGLQHLKDKPITNRKYPQYNFKTICQQAIYQSTVFDFASNFKFYLVLCQRRQRLVCPGSGACMARSVSGRGLLKQWYGDCRPMIVRQKSCSSIICKCRIFEVQ